MDKKDQNDRKNCAAENVFFLYPFFRIGHIHGKPTNEKKKRKKLIPVGSKLSRRIFSSFRRLDFNSPDFFYLLPFFVCVSRNIT